jgi:hypothetical protein
MENVVGACLFYNDTCRIELEDDLLARREKMMQWLCEDSDAYI